MESEFTTFEPSQEMFAYLTPNQHAKFAHIIAQCGRVDLAKELAEANAVWLIQDGSVDLSQIDNYFHMIRYVTKFGDLKIAFLSLEEKLLFGAKGQWECLQRSLDSLYPNSRFVEPADIITLIVNKHKIEMPSENMEFDDSIPIEANIDRMNAPF